MKELFRRALRRLPKTQILVGAAIALASYAVTNWWKADVSDEIKHYSNQIQVAEELDGKLLNLAIFGTISNQLERILIELNKKNEEKGVGDSSMISSFNLLIPRSRQQFLIQDFTSNVSKEISDTRMEFISWSRINN